MDIRCFLNGFIIQEDSPSAAIKNQLSKISYQKSAIKNQLSKISYQKSAIKYQSSKVTPNKGRRTE